MNNKELREGQGAKDNSNLIPRTGNGLTFRPFRFLEKNSDQNSDHFLSALKKYRKPVLRKGKRWWIEYWFRVPADLQHVEEGKQWKKFRVFEDINREKSNDYAEALLDAVKGKLKDGFDPFEYKRSVLKMLQDQLEHKKEWTITQGLSRFLQAWADRGNEPTTLSVYQYTIGLLQTWLTARQLQNLPMRQLNSDWVENCLQQGQKDNGWSNRTYNNYLGLMRTAFNYLVKKELLNRSPGAAIDRKKTKSKKHRYYDPEKFKLVRSLMEKHDPALFFASKLVYYLCIRSNKELRNFTVGNIYLDRRQVLVQAETAKTDADRYVSIPDELYEDLAALRANYPTDYYVIGAWHQGNVMLAENRPGPKPFGKNFLTKRFGAIRKLAGLTSDWTIYSFKHTRIIHLKQDGGQDHDIIHLTGHTTFEAYAAYLRDLGIDGDPAAINKITRTF